MSKKLELLRRSESAGKTIYPNNRSCLASPPLSSPNKSSSSDTLKSTKQKAEHYSTSSVNQETINNNNCSISKQQHSSIQQPQQPERQKIFKTFFHRIGSTGMLNSKCNNSHTKQLETNQLYRSSSTSQLNTSSYVKCDDPTDGINLLNKSKGSLQQNNVAIKSSSCDDIAKVAAAADQTVKRGFPYAFLRSKLSVLPEENGGSVLNQKRPITKPKQLMLHSNDEPTTPQSHLRRYQGPASDNSPTKLNQQLSTSSRNNSIRIQSSDECSSNLSNSPRTSTNLDWEPAYQRLSSCLSSNESGYDSDGRHTEEHINGGNANGIGGNSEDTSNNVLALTTPLRNQLHIDLSRRLSTCSVSSGQAFDCSTIRRRFRQIKLNKINIDDSIGLVLTPQRYQLNDVDVEIRYLISDIEVNGLAYG